MKFLKWLGTAIFNINIGAFCLIGVLLAGWLLWLGVQHVFPYVDMITEGTRFEGRHPAGVLAIWLLLSFLLYFLGHNFRVAVRDTWKKRDRN